MTTKTLRNGDPITYRPRFLDFDVSAKVERVHKDGTVTVQARFLLSDDGEPEGCFLGYTYRIGMEMIHARA